MIEQVSCTESNCQPKPPINLDKNEQFTRQTSASLTASASRLNRRRNAGNRTNIRPRLNYVQPPAYLSRPILRSPSFLSTAEPIASRAGGFLFDNGSSSGHLVNLSGVGSSDGGASAGSANGSQLALTPDARACVTATYLCVLLVNNTWLDCNFIEMLCNNNTSSADETNSADRKVSARRQADSIVVDAQNATKWLAFAKRDDPGLEKALESALNGLIVVAGDGRDSGGEGPTREEDEGGGESRLVHDARLLTTSADHHNNATPIDLMRLAPDKLPQLPLKPPDIQPDHNTEEDYDGGGGAGVRALVEGLSARESEPVVLLSIQSNKEARVIDGDEERNRMLLEQYFRIRKHKQRNKNELTGGQQSEKFSGDTKSKYSHLDGRASYQQQLPTALPITSTQASVTSAAPATSAGEGSSSLVSWFARPFRGWSAYSFWPISLIATNQEIDYPPAASDFVQPPPPQPQPQTIVLRPMDRNEQFNDIATNQSLDQFKETINENAQALYEGQQQDIQEQTDRHVMLPLGPSPTDSFLASESAYQTPTTFSGSIVTAPTANGMTAPTTTSNHQLPGLFSIQQSQQQRNQPQLIPLEGQQRQQQPQLACVCDEITPLAQQYLQFDCSKHCAKQTTRPMASQQPSSFTTPTTQATPVGGLTTMGTSSATSTITPAGKMNPLDVTFLLYTRYHRDLLREMATDNLIVLGDPIDITNETLSKSRLERSLPIKIVIHGFGSGGRRPWVSDMVYKLLDYEDVNVIVVDWEKGATLPNYVQAAGNTRLVGHKIALLIQSINLHYGLTGNDFHLIGFSLGAHVAGFAGMEIRNTTSVQEHWINRITGLDPASPLFEGYEANDRLDPSDAQFVDVIHSNGDGVLRGGFGSLQPMGHVDFYPNGGRVQVGCNSVILSALSDIIYGKWQSLCNHRRALNFFMDSFELNKCRFRSFNCDSYESYLKGECFDCGLNKDKCSYMGYRANSYPNSRGKMYLTTHEDAPFCANQMIIKIIGSRGFKTHWGKVEVTLVTVDGKNESFLLSSLNGQTSGGHELPNGQRESSQHNMQSLIVAHSTLVNFTHVLLRYTKYKGWIYSGDESWPIDKVFLMDSDGQVKSFCGFNTILESHITTRLELDPVNCTVNEPNSNNHNLNRNVAPATPSQQMGRGAQLEVLQAVDSASQSSAINELQRQQTAIPEHLQQRPTRSSLMLNEDNQQDSLISAESSHDQRNREQQSYAHPSTRSPRLYGLIIQANGDADPQIASALNHLAHRQARVSATDSGQPQLFQRAPVRQIAAF